MREENKTLDQSQDIFEELHRVLKRRDQELESSKEDAAALRHTIESLWRLIKVNVKDIAARAEMERICREALGIPF